MVCTWGLLVSSVVSEVIQFQLHAGDCVIGGAVFEPWTRSVDPLEKIGCESLVLVLKGFVALVDGKRLGDTVGGLLGLKVKNSVNHL